MTHVSEAIIIAEIILHHPVLARFIGVQSGVAQTRLDIDDNFHTRRIRHTRKMFFVVVDDMASYLQRFVERKNRPL